MTQFQEEVARILHEAEDPDLDSQARGRKFEELLIYMFDSVDDSLVAGNVTSGFAAEQIDIAVSNRGGFPGLPSQFLVECKNYSSPLDSKSVGYFLFICLSRRAELAVIVAKSGLTGNAAEQNHALSLAKAAAPMGCRIVVITREDIVSLSSPSDLVDLMETRYLIAFASGGVGQ
ncbi:restriction endonuclease [Microbacterium terrisoli]|uniref:restriction endonuclease n=1 Tax=Microbacterium terrisoli TaxID=3242192 RepID=UPI002805E7E1|nr:restriction endonuclease [Microbacterium protaetiae]